MLNIKKKHEFKILNETKAIHKKKGHFTKEEIKEYSALFIIINYPNAALSQLKEISEISFPTEENENFKKSILKFMSEGKNVHEIKALDEFNELVKKVEHDTNLRNILIKKNDNQRVELLADVLQEIKNMNQQKKIEYLEKKFAKNLDESSFSELIELKNQLNRD